jgi:hypothetical protein
MYTVFQKYPYIFRFSKTFNISPANEDGYR